MTTTQDRASNVAEAPLTPGLLARFGYRAEEEIGRGRTGIVHRAVHLPTGARVALKQLHGVDAAASLQLKREFHVLCEVQHPNLAHMHELVVEDGQCFFAMELVDGPDLRDWIRGTLGSERSPEEVVDRTCECLAQLAGALAAAHQSGWVHRDVKPGNVRMDQEGRAVLLDFGLSALAQDARQTVAGTLSYMAPEALWNADSGSASDVYSLGVLAYECITGRNPFPGSDVIQTDRQKQEGLPALPSHAPDWLRDLVQQMVAPRPEQRPSASEVQSRLYEGSGVRRERVIHPTLLGREETLSDLLDSYRNRSKSSATVVRLHGPSGVGKSHLLRTFCERVTADRSVTVLRNRCLPIATVPLAGVDGIADALCQAILRLSPAQAANCVPERVAELVQLFPVFAQIRPFRMATSLTNLASDLRERRRYAFEALRQVLDRVARFGSVVIWVDDLQWCDRDSLSFWVDVLTRPIPVYFVASSRSADSTATLVGEQTLDMPIAPLPQTTVVELVEEVFPESRDTAASQAIANESHGNPFLALQLAEHARSGAQVDAELTLGRMLTDRLTTVSDNARELLELACLATKNLPLETLGQALSTEMPLEAMHELIKAGRLVERVRLSPQIGLVPYHDRVREAVVDGISETRRRSHHLRLAQTIGVGDDADPVAAWWHWHESGDLRSAHASAIEAGDQLMASMAFDQAAEMYGKALDANLAGETLWHVQELLATAHEASGRGRLAGETYEAAADSLSALGTDALRTHELRRKSADAFLRSGYLAEGYDRLDSLLTEIDATSPASQRRMMGTVAAHEILLPLKRIAQRRRVEATPQLVSRMDTLASAVIGMVWADNARSAYYQARYSSLALRTTDEAHRVRAIASESCYLAAYGSTWFRRLGTKYAKESVRLAATMNDPNLFALCSSADAATAFLSGDLRSASTKAQATIRHIERGCVGAGWELVTSYLFGAWALGLLGDLNALETMRRAAIEHAELRDDRLASAIVLVGLPNITWLARGNPAMSKEKSESALLEWPSEHYTLLNLFALVSQVQAELYDDQAARARELFDAQTTAIRGSLLLYNQFFRVLFLYLDGCTALAASNKVRGTERVRLIKNAKRASRKLRNEKLSWAQALGMGLDAASMPAAKRHERMKLAGSEFRRVGMTLFESATGHHNGEPWPTTLSVADPVALSDCLLPTAKEP